VVAAAGLVGGLAAGILGVGAYAGGYPYPYSYSYGYSYACPASQAVYDQWGNFLGYRQVLVPC